MARKPPNYWNAIRCTQKALGYTSRKSFSDNARGAYKAACKNGWIDEVCQHMDSTVKPVGYWNKDNCAIEALKYTKRSEFQDNSGSSYNSARENKWLDEICVHMNVMRRVWKKSEVQTEVLKYKTRNEFCIGSPAQYSWAQKRKLLDDICKDMDVVGNDEARCIYSIVNKRLNMAYIGITYKFNKRENDHKSANNTTNSRKIALESDTSYQQLTGYVFSKNDIKSWAEDFFFSMYEDFGFQMLNDTSRIGGLGSSYRIWDFDACHKEALKYMNRRDFRAGSSGAWSASHTNGWADDVCEHMNRLEKPKRYWNKENCAIEALRYKYRSDFEKGSGSAYLTAMRNKWLDEICKHMTKKKIESKWNSIDLVAKEASKYNNRTDFSKKSGQAYKVASTNDWLEQVCSHMVLKSDYWTKERCKEVALTCTTKKELQNKSSQAYNYAKKNKWLKCICSHMKDPVMWNHYEANEYVWKKASKAYEKWICLDKCGSKKLSNVMGYDTDLLLSIVKYFKKGWVPTKDKEWIIWNEKT